MYLTNLDMRDDTQLNQITQYQLKGTWSPEFEILESVDFGVSISDNQFNRIRRQGTYAPSAQGRWSAQDFSDSLFPRTAIPGDFMNSFDYTPGTDYYFAVDPQAALKAFAD